MKKLFYIACLLLCLQLSAKAQIDLVTVPERRAVQLTIYNSADLTLVRDSRLLTFKKGNNVLQFTWAGTLIDASSLEIRFRTHSSELQLEDTVFPPQRDNALQWNVFSTFDGSAEIEITYFTSGISWQSSYKAHLTNNDSKLDLRGAVKISNHSGEDYPNAEVRLIVGHVNLVEKIGQLARSRGGWGNVNAVKKQEAYRRAESAMKTANVRMKKSKSDAPGSKPKGIVKEGLSEYFMFSIEGHETIPNGWEKSLNSVDVKNIPVEVTFRMKRYENNLSRFLRFNNRKVNDKEDKTNLGMSPLPGGAIHIFRKNTNEELSFLSLLNIPYIAINEKCELNTGAQDEVTVKRVLSNYRRENIKFDRWKNITSFDEYFVYTTTLLNTLSHPVLVEIERSFAHHATVSDLKYKKDIIDHYSFKFYPNLQARSEESVNYTVKLHHGS